MNAAGPEGIKYDFVAFPLYIRNGKFRPTIYTFDGARKTPNPLDLEAIDKVNQHVWRFSFERH